MSERVPELTAGDRIDAGGWLIEKEDPRLRHEGAGEREFLLHAATQASGQPLFESIHVEHAQVTAAALCDFVRWHAAEIADIADVFGHREIGVETEGLREITGG